MKRVREIVVSNVEIEDKFSWWFNTNDSQLYHFTLGKWSTLFGTASPSQDGLMSKEDKESLEEKVASLELLTKSGDKEKASKKLGSILKYVADKGIEVGIALLPYLGEISKLLQGNQRD